MLFIEKKRTDNKKRVLWQGLIIPRLAAAAIIRIYQKTISFDHGFLRIFYPYGFCRFQPTCSEYARSAILKYGCWRGGFKAIGRILRCHPWSPGGWDPVK